MIPKWVLASSPFSATASFHLNFLNSPLAATATLVSASVRASISCFSFLSEVLIVPLVAKMSSNLLDNKPKSLALSVVG